MKGDKFNLLIVAATPFELTGLVEYLKENTDNQSDISFEFDQLKIDILITGVGMMHTTYALTKILNINNYDLVINAGVAGAYNRNLEIGEVVLVESEEIGDLGAEEKDGSFMSVFQMNLVDPNFPPFQEGRLLAMNLEEANFLKKVKGLSVNKVHGSSKSIFATRKKYDVDIESMEGAAFFFVCLHEEVNFLQIRSISNYVEPRNKDNWNLPLAINNLNQSLIDLIASIK